MCFVFWWHGHKKTQQFTNQNTKNQQGWNFVSFCEFLSFFVIFYVFYIKKWHTPVINEKKHVSTKSDNHTPCTHVNDTHVISELYSVLFLLDFQWIACEEWNSSHNY